MAHPQLWPSDVQSLGGPGPIESLTRHMFGWPLHSWPQACTAAMVAKSGAWPWAARWNPTMSFWSCRWMSPRRSRSSAVGEVFTLYFSQRIASTELDRTREPIPVRLLTHSGGRRGLLAGTCYDDWLIAVHHPV